MATIKIKDGDGVNKWLKVSSGAGTEIDPYVNTHSIEDEDGRVPVVDANTHALIGIDYLHHEIHSGSAFRVGAQLDLANGGTFLFALTTPDSLVEIHFRPSVDAEVEAKVELFENPTAVVGGTSIPPRNANRNFADNSVLTALSGLTSVDLTGAVQIGNQVVGSGKSSGGSSDAVEEFVLKHNTTYVMRVTNNAVSNNQINLKVLFYQHTAKA